jgi:hypothetical protein
LRGAIAADADHVVAAGAEGAACAAGKGVAGDAGPGVAARGQAERLAHLEAELYPGYAAGIDGGGRTWRREREEDGEHDCRGEQGSGREGRRLRASCVLHIGLRVEPCRPSAGEDPSATG